MSKFEKALVVSDTHRNKSSMNNIARQFADFDYLFHLGDNVEDAAYLKSIMPGIKLKAVKGNCDLGAGFEDFKEIIIKGNKIILTHGHKLKVKYSYDRVLYYALEQEAAAILFGHTHIAYKEYVNGVWLVNPGSAGDEMRGDLSVAVLLIGKNGIVPKIVCI